MTLSTPAQDMVLAGPGEQDTAAKDMVAAGEMVAGNTNPLTIEHRPASPCHSSGVCGRGGQIMRPFGRDVAQSRNTTGCHSGKPGFGHHHAESAEEVLHLRSTMRRADNTLEKSNPRRTHISDARPSARPQHPKRLPYCRETMARPNVVEGQT